MNATELMVFERMEGRRECLQVRKWDDQAKTVGIEHQTPRAVNYQTMIASVLAEGGVV
jgi:hypothetical protein